MGESQNQNEKKQEDLEYSEILDKQLAEMLPDIHFNTITREEFAEYEGYKNQLAELKTKYEQKCVKFNELLQKSRELQEVYKTTTQENNKLKEKAKVQPQIIDEFRARLIKEAWLYFSDPKAKVMLPTGYQFDKEEYIRRMKRVAVPQQNTVTRTKNAYNNSIVTETIKNGQTAQTIKSTL